MDPGSWPGSKGRGRLRERPGGLTAPPTDTSVCWRLQRALPCVCAPCASVHARVRAHACASVCTPICACLCVRVCLCFAETRDDPQALKGELRGTGAA